MLGTTITFRVSDVEKELIAFFARTERLSVGRYLVALMQEHGGGTLQRISAEAKSVVGLAKQARRRTRKKATYESLLGGFQVPFLQRKHAHPFRRSVEHAANEADVSAFSVAWVASHLFEAIAREVARGEVVRIPGIAVIGPWRIEGRGVCVPRFQSCQAFDDFVLVEGEREGANRALQAHRRRRRQRIQNLPKAMAAYRARVEAQNRRLLECFEAWHEYGGGVGLY